LEILVEVECFEIRQHATEVCYTAHGNRKTIERDEEGNIKIADTTNKRTSVWAKYFAGEERDESKEIENEIREEIEHRIKEVRSVFPDASEDHVNIQSFLDMIKKRFPEG